MGLFLQHKTVDMQWVVWKMEESLDTLFSLLPDARRVSCEQEMQRFTSDRRKLEWLSVRVLLYSMLQEDKEIGYSSEGKPHLTDNSSFISISHTKGYVAVILSSVAPVGIDIEQYGIVHNRCVDDDLMIRFAYQDKELMDFLKVDVKRVQPIVPSMFEEYDDQPTAPSDAIMLTPELYAVKKKNNKDTGQRQFCGCIVSKDIGQYNTCPHLCEYCYANTSKEAAVANWERHKNNPNSEKIIG